MIEFINPYPEDRYYSAVFSILEEEKRRMKDWEVYWWCSWLERELGLDISEFSDAKRNLWRGEENDKDIQLENKEKELKGIPKKEKITKDENSIVKKNDKKNRGIYEYTKKSE